MAGIYNKSLLKYRGEFLLDIGANESVFITFPLFRLDYCDERVSIIPGGEWVEFEERLPHGTKWKKGGIQKLSPEVYRNSVKLVFSRRGISENEALCPGFKMMFVITLRSQEPKKLSNGLFNCSVHNFKDFKPLLHCNHLVECAGSEDEKNCDFQSEECGEGMIDAGNKCYKLYRLQQKITWYNAASVCKKQGMQLVTIATPEEYHFLLDFRMRLVNSSGFFVGAQPSYLQHSPYALAVYGSFIGQWIDGRIAFYMNLQPHIFYVYCTHFVLERFMYNFNLLPNKSGHLAIIITGIGCDQKLNLDILCESKKANSAQTKLVQIKLRNASAWNLGKWKSCFVQCPAGHVTRTALSCDITSDCGVTQMTRSCRTDGHQVHIPMFLCETSRQSVHYSLVCDHIAHCSDSSDEHFCHFPPCPLMFTCRNRQCIPLDKFCDGVINCLDGTDEQCNILFPNSIAAKRIRRDTQLSIIYMTGSGKRKFVPMRDPSDCPSTHFLCPFGDCLPLFLRCNGIDDCPGHEDETECDDSICPGLYRCLGSKVCLHPDNLCDGWWQCPRHDDEILCDSHCPASCFCQGLAFICFHHFNTSSYPNLRLLDASGSDMTLADMGNNPLIIHLNMSRCGIGSVPVLNFSNLRVLDLRSNKIVHFDIKSFLKLQNLLFLDLSSNPLSTMQCKNINLDLKLNVIDLDLSNTSLQVYNSSVFAVFGLLKHLNISNSKLTTVTHDGFQTTPLLKSLDARGSPLTSFPTDVFKNLEYLSTVYVDNYKLCCPVMLPAHFHQGSCHTKYDLLSSCEDLLKSTSYRIFLWSFSVFAVLGNVSSFVSRIYLNIHGSSSGIRAFGIFVSNLCMADFLMGIYLTIVGAADLIYQGKYLFHDEQWKKSPICKFAGALSLLSTELSAFMISLITLDRLLVIRFPFSQVHFKGCSALVVCVVLWMVGLVLATLPLLPVTSHWEFFSQTGLCVPLPFSGGNRFSGYTYSFAIMIVLNFVLFVLIACGQLAIYWSVRASSLDSTNRTNNTRDVTVARRLITVVLSDFLCWFPVGLLGVMGSTGTAIPDEVNVAVAIFVLPLNSALNPFLYTLNVVKEKRQKMKECRLMKQMETRMAISQIRAWLRCRVILEEDLEPLMGMFSFMKISTGHGNV